MLYLIVYVGPRLVGFDLDVNDGIITLLFSEAVDIDYLDYNGITQRSFLKSHMRATLEQVDWSYYIICTSS